VIEIPPITSLSFDYPWLLWLIPVPILLYYLWSNKPSRFFHSNVSQLRRLPRSFRQIFSRITLDTLFLLFVVCLFISAAKPQQREVVTERNEGRNIILVLDLSRSMSASDFGTGVIPVSRIAGLQQAVLELISLRSRDKIGLVLFGSEAFLQAPLTYDRTLLTQLIHRLRLGIVGDATALGDGMALALKRIREIEGDSKTVVVFTDGVSNAGEVDPIQAARIGRDLSVRIHTVGIGSNQRGGFTLPGGLRIPSAGGGMEFDERTLKEIANLTDGQYFHANNVEALTEISREIDRLETTSDEDFSKDQITDFSGHFALLALMAFFLLQFFQHLVFGLIN